MKLSRLQRELLHRAATGEDRQLPERWDPGPPPFVVPARRWYVPAGYLVPDGSAEYRSARSLHRRGLLKPSSIPRSPKLPYGNGGYVLTPAGRELDRKTPFP